MTQERVALVALDLMRYSQGKKIPSRLTIRAEPRAAATRHHRQEARRLQRGVSRNCLPNTRHKSLRSCRVRCVFIAKRVVHHLLFRMNTKREQDRERD